MQEADREGKTINMQDNILPNRIIRADLSESRIDICSAKNLACILTTVREGDYLATKMRFVR